jgi:hypothetical protein
MKTLYILGGVCGIAGVGFGIAVWFFHSSVVVMEAPATPESLPVDDIAASSTKQSGQDTLQHLLALGKTLECSFRTDGTVMMNEGTAFFDNGKMRVDTMYQGTSTQIDTASLIINGDTMYTWADTRAGSFALKLPVSAVLNTGAAHQDGEVSLQEKVQYECKPWHVDGSVFVPPVTVNFMDVGSIMKAVPKLPQTSQ